jgi:hypothetical protein
MAHNFKMTRALNSALLVVSIDNVENGLACECVCIICRGPLMAKQGQEKAHHFSHHHQQHNKSSSCSWSYETELHLIAKEVIRDSLFLAVPLGNNNGQIMALNFDLVEPELPHDNSNRRPDLTAQYGGETVYIEIAVTNPCKEEKRADFRRHNLNVIEVNLARFEPKYDIITFEEVNDFLVEAPKRWLSVKPAGYLAELIQSHERTALRDLMSRRMQVQREVELANSELNTLNRLIAQKRPDAEAQQQALAQIHTLYQESEQQLKAYQHELQSDCQALNRQKNQLTWQTEKEQETLLQQAKQTAEEYFSSEKQRLTEQYYKQLDLDNQSVIAQLDENKARQEQVTSEIASMEAYNRRLSQNNIALRSVASDLVKQQREVTLAKADIQNRVHKYSQVGANLKRISPELRKLTRRFGIPWPFDPELVDELTKPITEPKQETV